METYEVTALATDGSVWIYSVTGPANQSDQAVCEAYRKHGEARIIDPEIPELTPFSDAIVIH